MPVTLDDIRASMRSFEEHARCPPGSIRAHPDDMIEILKYRETVVVGTDAPTLYGIPILVDPFLPRGLIVPVPPAGHPSSWGYPFNVQHVATAATSNEEIKIQTPFGSLTSYPAPGLFPLPSPPKPPPFTFWQLLGRKNRARGR